VGAQWGDYDGAQYGRRPCTPNSPTTEASCIDLDIRNFRFNQDYRVDLILWREIIGGVTDALYIRVPASYSFNDNISVFGGNDSLEAPGLPPPLGRKSGHFGTSWARWTWRAAGPTMASRPAVVRRALPFSGLQYSLGARSIPMAGRGPHCGRSSASASRCPDRR
jgi:hypothetical protein